jgi:phage repressor protein C with HTH and peptisase S24 domain
MPRSFEQVGCIHSSQGLEFDYVGIIIGTDMRFENGIVITDYTKRDKRDTTISGLRTGNNGELADRIIRNTYKTLMSRGQKGCYVYCEDKALGEYLKERCRNTQEAFAEQRTYPKIDEKPEPEKIRYVKVKVYEAAPAAGPSEDLGEERFEEIDMPETKVLPGTDFVLKISGQSMEPEIMDGDLICVSWKARKSIRNGDIGIFNVDGAPYCKHYYQDKHGNVWLVSANEELRDTNVFIPYDSDIRFHCRGKVLGHNCTLPDYFDDEK